MDCAVLTSNIRTAIRDYLKSHNLQAVVLGLSGGIDSALTAALVSPICKELGIKFIGRSISIETNKNDEITRANEIGNSFCTDYKFIDLTSTYKLLRDEIEEDPQPQIDTKEYKLRVGNIKARLRMIYLYNLAQQHKGLVFSTDNYTEFMLGFWTLHGDVGDYNPLYSLWKTEVYALSNYLLATLECKEQHDALKSCIGAVPTDGLGITSSDVEQLGANDYNEVDNALWAYVERGENNINANVINRHRASQFKRDNPILVSREVAFKGV